jgi:hypothetical protein
MVRASEGGAFASASIAVVLSLLLSSSAARAEEAGAPPATSIEVHVSALGSLDPAARIAAIRALGDARAEAGVEPLVRVLRTDPSPEVRGWAVRALAQIGSASARAALAQTAQQDADERVRRLAIQLSGQVTESPFEATAPGPVVVSRGPGGHFLPMPPRQRRPGLALIIVGWAAFGVSYLASSIAGAASLAEGAEGTWSLFIPAVGPFVEIGLLYRYNEDPVDDFLAPLAVLLALDAAVQMVGIALGTLGLVRRHRAREAQAAGSQEGAPPGGQEGATPAPTSRRDWGVAVVPANGGLSLSGWF